MIRKYQKVEESKLATPEEHKTITSNLDKVGKTSAADLTEEERENLLPENLLPKNPADS